ncbi:MAG TPA: porin [Gemmatimonadales bacterium]|jgi:Phosphate-selective porin
MPPRPPIVVVLLHLAATALAAQSSRSTPPAVRWSGYMQARETYQDEVGLTGSINRARLGAAGSVPGNVSWRVQGEFRTGSPGKGASVSLQDAFVRWTRKDLGVQVGQFKTPFTREFITSLAEVETADRAFVVDTLAPKRDIGVMADYAVGGLATFTAGIFNGDGQNVTANADSSLLGVARATYRIIPYLMLGANIAAYFGDSTRYGVDLNFESPWGVVRAEYIGQNFDAGGDDDGGWYLLAAAPVTPWLQPMVKLEEFERGAVGAVPLEAWTVGANVRPWGRATRITLEYVSRESGDPGVRRGLGLAQFQVVF